MGFAKRPLFAVALSLLAIGCATKTGSEGKIVATINLGSGFETAAITGLLLILDAPGDAGLNLTPKGATEQTKSGHTYSSEVKDCDGDGRNEFCVTFAENPFVGGAYAFTFSGTWAESVLLSLRVVVQMQGGKQEAATKEQFDDGTSLRFVSVQAKAVTFTIPCRVGYSCGTTSATTLALTTTDPASPASSTTPKVKGTADSAWTMKLYSNAACTTLLATGSGSEFASPGIQVTVPPNQTTTLYAQATDANQNVSTCVGPLSYTHDAVAPAIPSGLALNPSSPANYNTPRLSGLSDNGATVRVFASGDCDGGITASGTAAEFDAGISLTVADNTTTTFSANAADPAGNVSACSSSVTFVEDSIVPSSPTGSSVNPPGPANFNSPTITGVALNAATVRVYKNDVTCATTATSGTVGDAGAFAVVVSVADNSTTAFSAVSVDLAGNVSPCTSLGLSYVEDSSPTTVSFADAGQSVSESVGTVTVTARLNAPTDAVVTVPYTVSGTATNPADHNLAAGSITIPALSPSATVTFNVVDDAIIEASETVILSLGTPTNATLGATTTHTVTILESKTPPVFAFATASQMVVETDGTVTVNATLSAVSSVTASAPFTVTGTAAYQTDHNLATGTISFAPGATAATVTFNIADDGEYNSDKTVVLTLETPTNATLGATAAHTVTIIDEFAVKQIVTGANHTCALLGNGKVRCWGYGQLGALGYGNGNDIGDDAGEYPSTGGDVQVTDGGERVTQITTSLDHNCALLSTGKVRCWGYRLYGRLGYGNEISIGDNEFPWTVGDVQVTDGGESVIQVSAGLQHTCALLDESRKRCQGKGVRNLFCSMNSAWSFVDKHGRG